MKVKIGEAWYSSDEQPICIQVSELEQKQISQMDRKQAPAGKYAIFPNSDEITPEEMRDWMHGGD
jgi:predicted transcriptional regulator YdeE